MATAATQYALAPDGVHLAYQVTGAGETDLVLMLGAVAHLEIAWEDPKLRRLFDRLGTFSRLIRFDRRGMGMSDGLDQMPTFGSQVEDFLTVMDAAGSERAILMGTIDAGTLALACAAAHPARVSAVVAFESTPRFTRTGVDDYGVEPDVLARMAAANQEIDMETHISIVAPGRKDDPGFSSWFRRHNRAASSGITMAAFMMMMMTWDITAQLPSVGVPVLIMHKTAHPILPIANARALAVDLPQAQLVELPGSGTAIFSGDVDEIADEVQGFVTGTRPPPRHDRVLATVVFTDIVGSTDRAAELGDRGWRELLEQHHRELRSSLDRFGGNEVHTAGDGFLATFDSPRRAIECARAVAEAVRGIGLEIRAGVHTGEIELSDGDVQGIAVHIGARVSTLAGPNEVLVSSTVRDLVTGSEIEFEDRGMHALKGVPGEWRIFAVSTS